MSDPNPQIDQEIGIYDQKFVDELAVVEKDEIANSAKPKFGATWSLLVFVYNCSGNSAFTMHMTISKVGLFWAVVITAFMIALICYSLNMLETVARALEQEQQHLVEIRNATLMSKYLRTRFAGGKEGWKGRSMSIINFLFTFGAVCSVQSDALTDLTLVTTNMNLIGGVSTLITKIGLFVAVACLILVVAEPTDHKGGLFTSSLIYGILVVTFFGSSIYLLASRGMSEDGRNAGFFDGTDLFDFASSINYSLNIGSLYFFNRNLMSTDVNLNSLTAQGLSSVAFLYLLTSMTAQRAFSLSALTTQDTFSLYMKEIPVLKYSIYAYLPVAVINCLIATLVAAELLESLKWIKKLTLDKDLEKQSPTKMKFARLFVWVASVAVTSLFDNVLTVISAAGSLFTPLVGFIIPLVYFYTYHLSRETGQLTRTRMVVDAAFLIVVFVSMYVGIKNIAAGKYE